jgi:hypothetical protein
VFSDPLPQPGGHIGNDGVSDGTEASVAIALAGDDTRNAFLPGAIRPAHLAGPGVLPQMTFAAQTGVEDYSFVHPTGRPISISTQSALKFPPT